MRGQTPALASNQRIWLNDTNEEVSALLRKRLLQNQALIITGLEQKESANSVINIRSSTVSQTASAYDSQGDIVEYKLSYQLPFDINGEAYTFSSAAAYNYSKAQLLSSEQNKKAALQDIIEQAVTFILRQL